MADYPARDQFFAHRFVRLVFRTCAAQEIGIEAVCLLTMVAHTEDSKRYRAAVTFWNHQLQSVLNMSLGRLNRARKKAIDAGWLHYEPGRKGVVGRYWVTIPPEYDEYPDTPMGGDDVDLSCQNGSASGGEAADKRRESGGQTEGKCTPFVPVPIPTPIQARAPSDEAFERFWKAYPRRVAKKEAGKAWARAIKGGADPEDVIEQAHRYAQAMAGANKRFIRYPATWLNQANYDDDPEEWKHNGREAQTQRGRIREETYHVVSEQV